MNALLRTAFMAVVLAVYGPYASGTPADDQQLTVHRLAIKGKSWALEVSLPASFVVEERQSSEDGEGVMLRGSDERSGLVLSAYLEKSHGPGDASAARDYYASYLAKSPLPQSEIRQYEIGVVAVREYMVREVQGRKVEQKNVNAFLSHEGHWVDVHYSKVLYRPSDQELFENVLKSIRISPLDPSMRAEEPATELYRFPVAGHGELILSIPASWERTVKKAPNNLPSTLILRPGKGQSFELMMTPLWSPKKDVDFNKPKNLRIVAEAALSGMLPSAVEKDVVIREFSAVDGPGYYFIVTDKAPGPGEFPLAMFSTVGVGDLLLSVTLLFRDKGSGDVEATIKVLQEIRQEMAK